MTFRPFEPSLYTSLLDEMARELDEDDEMGLAILLVAVEQEESAAALSLL